MKSAAQLRDESNQIGIQFLLTEVEMALSFLDIAGLSSDPIRRQRLLAESKKAFVTVIRLVPRFDLTPQEESRIDSKLQQIRYRLNLQGVSIRTL